MIRIKMRQLILLAGLLGGCVVAHAAEVARKGPQPNSCESKEITRVGFKDTLGFPEEGGRDYELWKCADGWRFSNLAGEQAFIKPRPQGEFSTCVVNSSTKEEFCCPQASQGDKTKTKVKNENRGSLAEAKKSSEWMCAASDGGTGPKNTLFIIPLDKKGDRSEVRYKISGYTEATKDGVPAKNRYSYLRVEAVYPNGTSKEMASGTIQLEQKVSQSAEGDPQECAPEKQKGDFCQLPPNLIKHDYKLSRHTQLLKDDANPKTEAVKSEMPPGGDTFK